LKDNKKDTVTALSIAAVVAFASIINFSILQNGFIVAMSIIMLEVFLFVYRDVSIYKITIFTAIFSPGFRLLISVLTDGANEIVLMDVFPDCVFFITYGILFALINGFRKTKDNLSSYIAAVFACDFISNTAELLVRSVVFNHMLLNLTSVRIIMIVAIVRAIIVTGILVSVGTYGNLMFAKVHDEEYKRLVVLNSVFESELYIMSKNVSEIEDIMKKAYRLHNELKVYEVPKYLADISLDISKDAHEIKGDYKRSIEELRLTLNNSEKPSKICISDLAQIIKADVNHRIISNERSIKFKLSIKTEFYVLKHYELISVIRNLINNAIEAVNSDDAVINLRIFEDGDNYCISVSNTGEKISDKDLPHIFDHGYSSKFNEETGDVQRGVGLVIVRDYVTSLFHGTVDVASAGSGYTEFFIRMPKSSFK